MRRIDYIVLHCTATPQTTTIESISNYWKTKLGWKDPGYHHVIKADGTVVDLHPITLPSNGVAGFNRNSIHISYIGGVNKMGAAVDNRTPEQKESMKRLVLKYKEQFPGAKIQGHRDFPNVKKNCPSFSVKDWLKAEGI